MFNNHLDWDVKYIEKKITDNSFITQFYEVFFEVQLSKAELIFIQASSTILRKEF